MPFFEDELGFIKWRDAMRQAKDIARASATPQLAKNVGSLMRDFPWLQPGTAYGLAQQGFTGEKARKVAMYDLYYQANETDRFGSKQTITMPQERLLAWEKELRQQIRDEKRRRAIDEKAGSAFGTTSKAANENPARVARFGDAGLDEIRAMRRTVRAALDTNDPVTMNAVLAQMQQRSAVKEDPYTASQSATRFASNALRVASVGPNLLAAVDDKLAGGTGQAIVRNAAVAMNMGQEGLAGVERGVVGFADDARSAFGLDNVGQPGFQQPSGVQSGRTGLDPLTAATGTGPYQEDPNGFRGLSPLAILEQTQGGQALIDLVQGKPVDTGSGWLPSYESDTAKAAAQASRDYSPYLIGGHAWTVGRAGADFARLEPDTTPFTIMSGAIDGYQAWQLDPANFALSQLAEANRARKVFDLSQTGNVANRVAAIEKKLAAGADETTPEGWAAAAASGSDAAKAQILRDAGVHVGRRAWMRAKNPIDWLYGAGTPVVQAIAKESDPWTIYWAFNGRIPIQSDTGQNVLEALARADNEADVRRILSTELGTSIDRVPKWRNGILGRPAPRLLSDMPTGVVDPEDLDGTAHTLVNWMKLGKVPAEEQRRIFNQWVMAEGRGDRYAAMDAAWDAVEAQARAAGAPEDLLAELFRRNRNEWDTNAIYGLNGDTGEAKPLQLLDENGNLVEVPGPRVPTERWNSKVALPDPAQIRKLVANKSWRWMVNHPAWAAGMALADGYQDLWKFVVLMRGAWPVRVIGDEMLRMSATGQSPFIHPGSYIAQVVGNPDDSRILNMIGKLGRKPTEEAVLSILDARAARYKALVEKGMDETAARAAVEKDLPIPRSFGQRWAEAGRRRLTGAGQNSVDIGGAPFDPNDLYGEALTARVIRNKGVARRVYLSHFDAVDRSSETWSRGLVEELYRAFSEPVTRRALRMSTDDFLEGLWTEQWGKYAREQMAASREASDPWRRVLTDRAASDQYGRQILDHLENLHRGDQRLIDAMVSGNFRYTSATGESEMIPLSYGGHPSDEAIDYARNLQVEGVGPDNLKVQRAHRLTMSTKDKNLEALNQFVDGAFTYLMTKPSNYLTRSPTFRQRYWDEVERLYPAMDQDTQAILRKTLEKANLSGDRKASILAKMEESGYGNLGFDEADTILKRRSLDYTRKLLYDLHKKSQFFDAARLVFPFGEAWKEVMTTWYRIFSEHPNALRRTQQMIQGAREAEFDPVTGLPTGNGEGFFHKDPTTGQEVFTYPLSGWLSQQSVNVPFLGKIGSDMPVPVPMRGAASSLNMVLAGLPALGPVAQVPVSEIVDDKPMWDGIRDTVFPFGEPEGKTVWSKYLNALQSNWGKKVERAASDPRMDRMKGNMVFDVMAALASTGEYDFANSEDATYELNRLYRDAKKKAGALSWVQALGAFTLPASPGFDFYAEDKTGNLVLLQQLRDEWNEKRAELYDKGVPNASSKAFRWFIDKYGTDNIFATQSKSRSNVVGLEPTKEMRNFERSNPDAVTNFPNTWALFAPTGGEYSYNVYLSQLNLGYRDPLQPMDMARDAINRRAEQVYSKYRKMVPDVPTREQSAWLADIRRQIAAQFPGATPGAYGGNEQQAARLAELELAAKDPKLSKTELGKALSIYFDARDKANAAALKDPKGKSSSISSSKETQRLRDWLYDIADELAAEYDGFSEAWDQVLSREFED